MEKHHKFLGTLFVAIALFCFWFGARHAQQTPSPEEVRQAAAQQASPQQASASQPAAQPAQGTAAAFVPPGSQPDVAALNADHAGATTTTLENNFIQVRFSNFGGAISDVAMKKYPAAYGDPSPAVFNLHHVDPMLAFVDLPGLDRSARYELVSQTENEVVYRARLDDTLEVTRRYTIAPDAGPTTDPYQLRCETTFRNLSDKPTDPRTIGESLGTAEPVNALDWGRQLATMYYNGTDSATTLRSSLQASGGLLGLGAHPAVPFVSASAPIVWATVKNQFFSAILTPDQPGIGLVTRRVKLLTLLPDTDPNAYGLTASAELALPAIPAHKTYTLGSDFYVGPNEYHRLANMDVFKDDQSRVMQFGRFTGWASKLMLLLMTGIHHWVPNWGLAIILATLTLKIVCLPLTLMAARSARRMQKIQPLMAALKEKYKDNPQKQQSAMIELYKEHKVNPAGSCIPMLLPMPFFFGFFYMLMSAAELRLAPFLWVHDLSAPDTVGYILGYPIRILPLIFVATSIVQMQLTPQPTVDNSQAKIMKFMPLFLLLIYYRYSCALSLYSTVNALFTIGQQLVVNKQKDDGDPMNHPKAGKSGRAVKNVTPKRR